MAKHTNNNIISQIKLPNNITYDIHDTSAIHSIEDLGLEEAMKFAEDNIDELPFPDEPEYVDGSYKIDKESTILHDEYFNYQEKE